jgi:hypothetical protein
MNAAEQLSEDEYTHGPRSMGFEMKLTFAYMLDLWAAEGRQSPPLLRGCQSGSCLSEAGNFAQALDDVESVVNRTTIITERHETNLHWYPRPSSKHPWVADSRLLPI